MVRNRLLFIVWLYWGVNLIYAQDFEHMFDAYLQPAPEVLDINFLKSYPKFRTIHNDTFYRRDTVSNILYAYKELDGSGYRIVAYTMPYQDEMYIVFVDSQQYGIVDEMHVAFFESLDVMFGWLRKGYDDVVAKQKQIDIIKIQDLTDLYRNFV